MKALTKSFSMLAALLKRDWLKLIFWLLAVLAFAASGAGKFVTLMQSPAQSVSVFDMFQNPALVGLFGPTTVKHPTDFTAAAAFGNTMPLITSITFIIVSVIYVINRTRKEEDDGIAELFRSFQVGKLANTTAVIIETFALQVLISFVLALVIQVQNIAGMTDFSSNLLFASSIGVQSFMWGMIALVLAQIFSNAGSAKGATFGLLGMLYIVRMGTDIENVSAGWFNPLSWSYLTDVFVKDNWLPIVLSLVLSFVLIVFAYLLENARDVNAGYIPEGNGKARASKTLLSFPGLVLRQQCGAIIGWIAGLFILGFVYGSMIGQISKFIKSSTTVSQIFAVSPTAGALMMTKQYLSTLFVIISVIVTCFAITSLSRMVSEERKNRQEQIYATALSRYKVYLTYTLIAWILGALAMFLTSLGIYLAQLGSSHALSFAEVMKPGMVYVVAIFFVLGLLGLLMALLPRFSAFIWIYVAFTFFMSYIGSIIKFPDWVHDLDVFYHIPKLATESMSWGNVSVIAILAVVFVLIGLVAYRRRDLIAG
ncbi:ABC transporter permease [Lactococcus nasutitermitis]|uniref:ABC transporter permease n=1 Tax=Lactococcus nasutitermitis TaxID=1652957 RepID=A0ABV9JDJ0_9LACT|nr:ABC transporter permease [Lactococcus nasutitermitis]